MAPTILVVEDEPAIQELLAVNLKHNGFLVVRAGSAEDADAAIRAAAGCYGSFPDRQSPRDRSAARCGSVKAIGVGIAPSTCSWNVL